MEVFNWLVALSGLSTLFTWGSICVAHLRFRKAWKVQGHSLEELPYKAVGGVYGSGLGVTLVVLVLIAQVSTSPTKPRLVADSQLQFYIAVWPVGYGEMTGGDLAENFFQAYLAAPVMIFFYVLGYLIWRRKPQKASEIDLDTGRKSWLTVEEMRQYRAERALAPWYVKVYRILFGEH